LVEPGTVAMVRSSCVVSADSCFCHGSPSDLGPHPREDPLGTCVAAAAQGVSAALSTALCGPNLGSSSLWLASELAGTPAASAAQCWSESGRVMGRDLPSTRSSKDATALFKPCGTQFVPMCEPPGCGAHLRLRSENGGWLTVPGSVLDPMCRAPCEACRTRQLTGLAGRTAAAHGVAACAGRPQRATIICDSPRSATDSGD
jgi:hypothetical protein